jgi:nitrite reductase (NO-forming)
MSHQTSETSLWSFINKVIGVSLAVGAAYFPVTFVYGGIQASYAKRQPVQVAQANTEPASAPTPEAPATAAPAATTAAPATAAASEAQIAAGQQTYMMVCFACHQPTGLGLPPLFPPLAGSDWVDAPKPDRLIRIVLHGLTGPITISGKPFVSPAPMMPPQGASLNDKQIADVLTYVRNAWGHKASAVTPEEVKAIREAEKAKAGMWTEAELLKIADR